MTGRPEEIGLLLVHGMGEQKRLDHLRSSARELASFIADTPGLIRMNVVEQTKAPESIAIDAIFRGPPGERWVRLHLHEVWWADLGIRGGLVEHVKFWFWGLGQWAAEVARRGRPQSNTTQLMAMPRFPYQATPSDLPGLKHKLPTMGMLYLAGLLAILTYFTWSAAKQIVAWLSRTLPNPSLIFMFLGDVKTYERPGGPGKGTLLDPDMPMRATIRRRMVSEMVAMAARPYHRWYVFAHSLGGVVAYNALQETELCLPNYLTQAEWDGLSPAFKTEAPFTPPDAKSSTDHMMPRRPPWLAETDGISRRALFGRFRGFVTWGCPLDKFAALWPRVVCLNRQAAVFPADSEWINLHDPTDPVAARIDAFAAPGDRADEDDETWQALTPDNFAARASLAFGVSHIRYFSPRRWSRRSMPAAIVKAVVRDPHRKLSQAARGASISGAEAWARMVAAVGQVLVVAFLMTVAAAALLIAIGKALPDFATTAIKDGLGRLCPGLPGYLQSGDWKALLASAAIVLILAVAATTIAGLVRMVADVRHNRRRSRR